MERPNLLTRTTARLRSDMSLPFWTSVRFLFVCYGTSFAIYYNLQNKLTGELHCFYVYLGKLVSGRGDHLHSTEMAALTPMRSHGNSSWMRRQFHSEALSEMCWKQCETGSITCCVYADGVWPENHHFSCVTEDVFLSEVDTQLRYIAMATSSPRFSR